MDIKYNNVGLLYMLIHRGHDVRPLSVRYSSAGIRTSRFIPWTVNTLDVQMLSSKPQKSKIDKWKNAKKRGFYYILTGIIFVHSLHRPLIAPNDRSISMIIVWSRPAYI